MLTALHTLPLLALLAATPPPEPPRLQPCHPEGIEGEARCGSLSVWEDRAARRGRKIDLKILVLPALGPERSPEAIFYLAGGPGGSATDDAGRFGSWKELRQRRDIVFVDQRGTGGSNPLHCDFGSMSLAEIAEHLFPPEKVKRCREELEKKADLRLYTTAIAMDDLDEVRAWLGYSKIDLYGGSYGTLAAQVYLRRHGEHVRTAVLDGIAAIGDAAPLSFARSGQRALDLLFDECLAAEACRKAFPNVREELAAVMKKVDGGVKVTVKDPRSGKSEEVRPNRGLVAEGIRYLLYSQRAGELPLLIHQAFQGDLAPLVGFAIGRRAGIFTSLDLGEFLSVTCAEEVPFIEESAVARETVGTLLGDFRVREQQRACALWPRARVSPEERQPVRSEVPVLLFSGERDPVTPPAYGERVAALLPNSLHVVTPHSGHGTDGPCAEGLILKFLDSGSVKGLDPSCVRSAPLPAFATGPAV